MTKKARFSRRQFIGAAIAAGAGLSALAWWRFGSKAYTPSVDITPGIELLKTIPVVDVHGHPGRSFLVNGDFDSFILNRVPRGFEQERLADMKAGLVTACLFAMVSDVQLLELQLVGGLKVARKFHPGEAFADFKRQLDYFLSLFAKGELVLALSAEDIRAAHRNGQPVAVLSCEGAGFVEDKLERLSIAYDAGLRSITLVHYRPSEYGDVQTSAPDHGGLTALGREMIREMNRVGILIDMAHASFATVRDTVELSDAPIMISHSHLSSKAHQHPRLLSAEHARLIVENGGIVGSWPSGIANRSMADFVDETLRLIDLIGIEHVAIGTDLDANYKPVLTDYRQFPELATLLLHRGLTGEETGKLLGFNFLRVFEKVANQAKQGQTS